MVPKRAAKGGIDTAEASRAMEAIVTAKAAATTNVSTAAIPAMAIPQLLEPVALHIQDDERVPPG